MHLCTHASLEVAWDILFTSAKDYTDKFFTTVIIHSPRPHKRVLQSRFKVALTNATNVPYIFGAEFVVQYWHAKHEI